MRRLENGKSASTPKSCATCWRSLVNVGLVYGMRAPFSFWPGPFKPHRVRGAVLTIRNDLCVQASRPAVACVDLKACNRPVVDQPLQRFRHVVPRLLARGFGGLGALQQPQARADVRLAPPAARIC